MALAGDAFASAVNRDGYAFPGDELRLTETIRLEEGMDFGPAANTPSPLEIIAAPIIDMNAPEPEEQEPAGLSPEKPAAVAAAFAAAIAPTIKLREGTLTNAAAQGPARIEQNIAHNAATAQQLQAAIDAARLAAAAGPDQTVATAPAADDEGIAHGLPPAPATAETVGAGSFGIQNSGDFAAPQSLRGKESAYKTVERSPVDVMQQRQVASAPFGIAADLSALPGRIDHIVTPSLDGVSATLKPDQYAPLEAAANRIGQDARIGKAMFDRWRNSDVTVTGPTGDLPRHEMKAATPGDELALQNPDFAKLKPLDAAPRISALRI